MEHKPRKPRKPHKPHRPRGTGSVRWVRTDVWQLRWQEAGRSRSQYVYGTKTKADAAVRELVRESARVRRGNLLAENPRMTVREWLDYWLSVAEPDLAPTTAQKYRRIVEHDLVPVIGNVPIRDLGVPDVEALLARYAGRPWQKEVHTVLRSALQKAERAEVVSRNVARLVRVKAPERAERKVFSLDEVKAFVEAVRGDGLEAYFLTALMTGARSGELRALRWSDVNLDTGELRIERGITRTPETGWVIGPPKTQNARRTVWLPEEVSESLRKHRVEQWWPKMQRRKAWAAAEEEFGELVFRTRTGRPLTLQIVGRKLHKLLDRAGLPRVRGHDLRHMAATYQLAQGVPMPVVSRQLGHATIGTTVNTYGHVTPESQREASEKLAEVVFGKATATKPPRPSRTAEWLRRRAEAHEQ